MHRIGRIRTEGRMKPSCGMPFALIDRESLTIPLATDDLR